MILREGITMNEQEFAWKKFEDTGCVEDYLSYCRMKSESVNEFQNQGDSADSAKLQ